MSTESDDTLLDTVGYIGGVLLAVCTLPQLWHMYSTQSASDLQKRFLILYLVGCILTFAYLVAKNAWAAWITMTVEITLTLFTLFYKIYLDSRIIRSDCFEDGKKVTSVDLTSIKISASLVCADDCFDIKEHPEKHSFTALTTADFIEGKECPFFSDIRFRGFHILLDYSGFETKDPKDLSDWTMSTIQTALKDNEIRCVHSHSEVFEDVRDAETPPGFTAVCLLDESHVSAHCYSAIGLLAIDVFTCGGKPHQTFSAAKDIHRAVMNHLPCKFMGSSTFRFPYRIGAARTTFKSG